MADQKKDPQPFNKSLFSSASPGLTFDIDQDSILSPFSIEATKKPEKPSKSSGSTPTPPGKSSPGLVAKNATSKTPSPMPISLFQTPVTKAFQPPSFEVSSAVHSTPQQQPSVEVELEDVSLSSPSHLDPPLADHSTATTQSVPAASLQQAGFTPGQVPGPSQSPSLTAVQGGREQASNPPLGRVPPTGGGAREESNPYRLSGRSALRPSQAPTAVQQAPAFNQGAIPQATAFNQGSVQHPPAFDPRVVLPPTTSSTGSSSGFSPILPPPTSGPTLPSQSQPAAIFPGSGVEYVPVRPHWFFLRSGDHYWMPFTQVDTARLEQLYQKQLTGSLPSDQTVTTDGGRYDVHFVQRKRKAVYWEEAESQVRRGAWYFRRESDRWYTPYEEALSAQLEEEYRVGVTQGMWNRRVPLSGGDVIVMHSASSLVHYPPPPSGHPLDIDEQYTRPRAVKREFSEADQVSQGEQSRVDHLVFVVHGIGPFHDINFRSIVDCVDDFREVSQLMIQTHRFPRQAPQGGDDGGRVEYLPIHWHSALHRSSQDGGMGVDQRLEPVTLKSIKRLRDFTNETLLDILYYTSPVYAQTIVTQVAMEMNRLYQLFMSRNPSFQGGVSVMGHSLGSCIAFDLLAHQGEAVDPTNRSSGPGQEGEGEGEAEEMPVLREVLGAMNLSDQVAALEREQIDYESLMMLSAEELKELGVPMGPRKKLVELITREKDNVQRIKAQRKAGREEAEVRDDLARKRKEVLASLEQTGLKMMPYSVSGAQLSGTGQSLVEYPALDFTPDNLFALGSPIALFLTVRGVDGIGPDFILPTCPKFFNIFHPYDPVAYRIEPLVNPSTADIRPVLLPHHKGRKRFHLELYDNLGRVGASLKENIVSGMKNMWVSLSDFARSHSSGQSEGQTQEEQLPDTPTESHPPRDLTSEVVSLSVDPVVVGRLNGGHRVDFMLQERAIEKLNEYLFALSSHLTYWQSEDTALFVLKQAYEEPHPELVKT